MYRIGEFSYLFQVTLKTLRYYDKIKLFCPSYVDPFTGYRYYSEDQEEEFKNILNLKDLGFSLEEIKKLKEELTKDALSKKIEELLQEQQKIKNKISTLENLKNKGEKEMNYMIGFSSSTDITVIGRNITVEDRKKENLEIYFQELKEQLKKLKVTSYQRVIITEEIGLKYEDVELFIGYKIPSKEGHELRIKKERKLKKLNLDFFAYPSASDYLVAIDIKKKEDIPFACQDVTKYANKNEIQILGPFMEIYNERENDIQVFAYCNDLKREEILNKQEQERWQTETPKFILDKNIIGKWKIKEILPNIRFNPNKQKSEPETIYQELEFLDDGTTNYPNVSWTKNILIIKYDNKIIHNHINHLIIGNKEYLDIRMSDMSRVYPNAKPISYIYEKIK